MFPLNSGQGASVSRAASRRAAGDAELRAIWFKSRAYYKEAFTTYLARLDKEVEAWARPKSARK